MTSASSGIARPGADLGDLAVVDQHVDLVALAVKPHSTKQHTHAITPLPASPVAADSVPTSRWNSTAIRT